MSAETDSRVAAVLDRLGDLPGALLPVLHEIQHEIGHIPPRPTQKRGTVDDDDSELLDSTLDQWPHYLRKPLLKIPEGRKKPYSPKGCASGVRSGMVKLNGKWYRLKGLSTTPRQGEIPVSAHAAPLRAR